jgi:hypothetical protein
MPLALAILSIMLIVVAVRGNVQTAGELANETFFGSNGNSGFLLWFGSIIGIAVIFRLIQAPRAGETFIALLVLVFFLKHNGIIQQIDDALQKQAQSGGK